MTYGRALENCEAVLHALRQGTSGRWVLGSDELVETLDKLAELRRDVLPKLPKDK